MGTLEPWNLSIRDDYVHRELLDDSGEDCRRSSDGPPVALYKGLTVVWLSAWSTCSSIFILTELLHMAAAGGG